MPRKRWTIKELQEKTDVQIVETILTERRDECTNVYSPLYERLSGILKKLDTATKVEDGMFTD